MGSIDRETGERRVVGHREAGGEREAEGGWTGGVQYKGTSEEWREKQIFVTQLQTRRRRQGPY